MSTNLNQNGTKPITSKPTKKEIKQRREPVVWAENRDEIFHQRLSEDMAKLREMGFKDNSIAAMMGQLTYVKFYNAWPKWLYPVDKLPKGYTWSMGVKYSNKATNYGRSDSQTYIFLPIGDDLYIKVPQGKLIGINIYDTAYLKVINFRLLTANEFLNQFSMGSYFNTCLEDFWHNNGGRAGYIVPLWEPRDADEAKEMWLERKEFNQSIEASQSAHQ